MIIINFFFLIFLCFFSDQILASIKYACAEEQCQATELYDLLQEMDRRYFLLQDLRWEFSMLDRENTDTISVEQARFVRGEEVDFFRPPPHSLCCSVRHLELGRNWCCRNDHNDNILYVV